MAFKNAVILHAKEFYQISYEVYEQSGSYRKCDYFSTLFEQKPHADYILPIIENFYLNDHKNFAGGKKYFFSFLYDPITFQHPDILKMKVDSRFSMDLIREVMQIRLNRIGIHTRQFYSSDMKRIFMILKAQDGVLRITAEVQWLSVA